MFEDGEDSLSLPFRQVILVGQVPTDHRAKGALTTACEVAQPRVGVQRMTSA